MSHEKFVTDNPFRAVGAGSGLSLAALRRKADAAAQAARVGLAPEVPLAEIFGTIPLEDLPSAIRALVNDGGRRTAYRLLWPLSSVSIAYLQNPVPDPQLDFLAPWYRFLQNESPADATDAFAHWETLRLHEPLRTHLAGLLVEEDNVTPEAGAATVLAAQKLVALTVLGRAATAAARIWESGDVPQAALLAKAILSSPIDDALEDQALAPLAEVAERLEARVEALIRDMPEWHRGDPSDLPDEVTQLERLGKLLANRYPSAADWSTCAQRWTTELAWRMREEAIRFNKASQDKLALEVMEAARKVATDSAQIETLRRDIQQLKGIAIPGNERAILDGVLPIKSAPSLGTLNGMGVKLYGRQAFPPDPRCYWIIHYIVIAWIPIFPLDRFLVMDSPGGGWSFLGKSRWTNGMKIHMSITVGLIFILLIWSSIARASTPASAYESSSSSVTSSAPAPSRGNQDNPLLEEESNRLKTEIDRLDRAATAANVILDKQEAELARLRARIKASHPNLYSRSQVNAHNRMVDQHEALRKKFNAGILTYEKNRKILDQKYKRYEEVIREMAGQ